MLCTRAHRSKYVIRTGTKILYRYCYRSMAPYLDNSSASIRKIYNFNRIYREYLAIETCLCTAHIHCTVATRRSLEQPRSPPSAALDCRKSWDHLKAVDIRLREKRKVTNYPIHVRQAVARAITDQCVNQFR